MFKSLISLSFPDTIVLDTTESHWKTRIHRNNTMEWHVFIFKGSASCSLYFYLLKHAWSSSSRVCSFVSLVEKTERSMTPLKYLPLPTTRGKQNERRPYWKPASDWFSGSNISRKGRQRVDKFLCLFMLLSLNITLILARNKVVFMRWHATFQLHYFPF